jgi:hypothetical protein
VDLDMLCKRYSLKPSEVSKDNIKDFQFNILVASVAMQAEYKAQEKAMQKAKIKRG